MRLFTLLACCAALITLGCEAPRKTATAVKVQIGSAPELDALIASHKGQVVVVDFWATWCPPCVENFPHIVELAKKHRQAGLRAISVSLDDPDTNLAGVQEYLARQNADFEHLISKDGGGTASVEAFNLDQVPHYRLYDRAGELAFETNEPNELDAKIEELLAK